MHLLLQDATGRTFEASLLAVSRYRLRVAVHDHDDAVDLVYSYGVWRSEEGRPLEIGAILADSDCAQGLDPRLLRATAAGCL